MVEMGSSNGGLSYIFRLPWKDWDGLWCLLAPWQWIQGVWLNDYWDGFWVPMIQRPSCRGNEHFQAEHAFSRGLILTESEKTAWKKTSPKPQIVGRLRKVEDLAMHYIELTKGVEAPCRNWGSCKVRWCEISLFYIAIPQIQEATTTLC